MIRNALNPFSIEDPSAAYLFRIELDGLLVAGFTEVSGLEAETNVEEYWEGGLNGYVHHFPSATRYPRLVLKRGITSSNELWEWYESVMTGSLKRKDGSVILNDYDGVEIWRWNFFEAYPVKWIGPELSSSSGQIAFEALEIVHNGLKKVKAPIAEKTKDQVASVVADQIVNIAKGEKPDAKALLNIAKNQAAILAKDQLTSLAKGQGLDKSQLTNMTKDQAINMAKDVGTKIAKDVGTQLAKDQLNKFK